MFARAVFRSRPRIKVVLGFVARRSVHGGLLLPWLAILAWLYSHGSRQEVRSCARSRRTLAYEEILMSARLYGLWVLSVILALILAFLTPGMLTLLPVPW